MPSPSVRHSVCLFPGFVIICASTPHTCRQRQHDIAHFEPGQLLHNLTGTTGNGGNAVRASAPRAITVARAVNQRANFGDPIIVGILTAHRYLPGPRSWWGFFMLSSKSMHKEPRRLKQRPSSAYLTISVSTGSRLVDDGTQAENSACFKTKLYTKFLTKL